jgi:hypothetical protein
MRSLWAFLQGIGIGWTWAFKWTGYEKGGMSQFHYFTDEEIAGLQGILPAMLDQARGIAGVPFRLTATTGGEHAPNSAHYKGLAVDIGLGHLAPGFERNTQRWAILKGLFGAGFKRIEIAECHIHCDIGEPPEYVSPTSWLGTDS